jgi:copper chaperone CopZ
MKKATIKINGMHCSSCEMLIKDALDETEGVTKADVSNTRGAAIIFYDENKVTEDQLKLIIKKEGYEVK